MKIVAHRGYSSQFPENSLLAFERAIQAGADYIETDVRRTRDGVLMCWHDPDLRRVAGIDAAIAQRTAAELEAIALPGNASLCRLDAVLVFAKDRVPVMLDIKIDDASAHPAIIAAIETTGMTGEVVYGVRTAADAAALIDAGARFARLAMPAEPELLEGFPDKGLLGARLWEDQVNEAAIARIRARKIEVWVTAGVRSSGEAPGYIDAQRCAALMRLGADAVLVNDVALACSIARRRNER